MNDSIKVSLLSLADGKQIADVWAFGKHRTFVISSQKYYTYEEISQAASVAMHEGYADDKFTEKAFTAVLQYSTGKAPETKVL